MLRRDVDTTITRISVKKLFMPCTIPLNINQSALLFYFPRHCAVLCFLCVSTVERIIMLSVTSTFTFETQYCKFLCLFLLHQNSSKQSQRINHCISEQHTDVVFHS